MNKLVSFLTFIILTSLSFGQSDTVFIKSNKDIFKDIPKYQTDTVIFDTPNARQILYGTTVLPMTSNQIKAINYGISLDSVSLNPCKQEKEDNTRIKNQVIDILENNDSLTIEIKFWGNCCHSFLCDIEILDDATINLVTHGYGAMYCDFSCCYGLSYYFSTIKEIDGFHKLKYVSIQS